MTIEQFQFALVELNNYIKTKLIEGGIDVSERASILQSFNISFEHIEEINKIEELIDESGIIKEEETSLLEKVQQLINKIKEQEEIETIPSNVLKTFNDYFLKDSNGIYLIAKESE